jgi:predicted MFS family arabinose efflux permease
VDSATPAATEDRRIATPAPRGALVALGLAAGPVVALGFTRFAYALLLPPMRTELDWSYAAAGGMNTANAIGYVLGAASAAWWAKRFGGRAAFVGAMAVSALALVASGLTDVYSVLAGLRAVGGVSTAIVFVVGSVLASRIDVGNRPHRSAMLVAIYMAGVGVGVVLSGLAVPAALSLLGPSGWAAGWIVMGALAILAVAQSAMAARHVSEPAGQGRHTGDGASTLSLLAPTFAWYGLFGAGYVSYMTFVVALLRSRGLGVWTTASFFVVLGAASALATLLLWGRVIGRLRGGAAPALVTVVVLIGVLPVLLWQSLGGALISAVVFGASFMAGPTAATVLARRMLPAHGWATGIAMLTVAFSVGQAIGPLVAGVLSDGSGGIAAGLWLSVGLLAAAALTALVQRDPRAALAPSSVVAGAGTTSR